MLNISTYSLRILFPIQLFVKCPAPVLNLLKHAKYSFLIILSIASFFIAAIK